MMDHGQSGAGVPLLTWLKGIKDQVHIQGGGGAWRQPQGKLKLFFYAKFLTYLYGGKETILCMNKLCKSNSLLPLDTMQIVNAWLSAKFLQS